MTSRYEGKPFLRLLECYVLWAVDELPDGTAQKLCAMTPRLASTYGISGSWQEIVAAQMEFSSDLVDALRDTWRQCVLNAGDESETVDPEVWARQMVDSNFI